MESRASARYANSLKAAYVEEWKSIHTQNLQGAWGIYILHSSSGLYEWMNYPIINVPPKIALTEGSVESQCPLHCGSVINTNSLLYY